MPLENYIEQPSKPEKPESPGLGAEKATEARYQDELKRYAVELEAYKAELEHYGANRRARGAETKEALTEFNQPLHDKKSLSKDDTDYLKQNSQRTNLGTLRKNARNILEAKYQALISDEHAIDPEDKKALEQSHEVLAAMFEGFKNASFTDLLNGKINVYSPFSRIHITGEKSLAYVKHLIAGLNILAGYPANSLLDTGKFAEDETILTQVYPSLAQSLFTICQQVDEYYQEKYANLETSHKVLDNLEPRKFEASALARLRAEELCKEERAATIHEQLSHIEAACEAAAQEIMELELRMEKLKILEGPQGLDNPSLRFKTAIGEYKPLSVAQLTRILSNRRRLVDAEVQHIKALVAKIQHQLQVCKETKPAADGKTPS